MDFGRCQQTPTPTMKIPAVAVSHTGILLKKKHPKTAYAINKPTAHPLTVRVAAAVCPAWGYPSALLQCYTLLIPKPFYCSRGLRIVPVACCSACEIEWHKQEQPVVVVCGVVGGCRYSAGISFYILIARTGTTEGPLLLQCK